MAIGEINDEKSRNFHSNQNPIENENKNKLANSRGYIDDDCNHENFLENNKSKIFENSKHDDIEDIGFNDPIKRSLDAVGVNNFLN